MLLFIVSILNLQTFVKINIILNDVRTIFVKEGSKLCRTIPINVDTIWNLFCHWKYIQGSPKVPMHTLDLICTIS